MAKTSKKKTSKSGKDEKSTKKDKSAKGGKPAAKSSGKDLTPIQKAQLARAANKASGKKSKKKVKKAGFVFKAPEGTKPFFVRATLAYGKDGLFSDLKAVRIKGNAKNPDAKKVDMALWDPETHRRMGIRFAGASFVRNEAKRLPGNTQAQALFRVAISRDDGSIKVGLKEVKIKGAEGKKPKMLEKKDPMYRAIRKPVKFMAAAFTKMKDFPSAADLKALLKGQEE
jgi:hypothetical protein